MKDRTLFAASLVWAVLWVVLAIGDKGWIPQVDCLVYLGAVAAFIPLSIGALALLIRSLLRKRPSVGAGASILVILLALFVGFQLPFKPTETCQMPGTNAIIRLYVLESAGGATTSDSWRVTFQDETTAEKTIFSAYSSPAVDSIQCQGDAVRLLGRHQAPLVLSLQWIRDDLVQRPLHFSKSVLKSMEYEDQVRAWDPTLIPAPTPTTR